MSTTSSTSDLEAVAEEILSTLAEDIPGVRGVWKLGSDRLSAKKIRALAMQGRIKLHQAAEVLANQEAKATLEGADLYDQYHTTHSNLDREGTQLEGALVGIKSYQVIRKYSLHGNVTKWTKKASKHQFRVQVGSDRAKLGLNPHDGSMPASAAPTGRDSAAAEQWKIEFNGSQTLVNGVDGDPGEGERGNAHTDTNDHSEYAETHSIFGNPFKGYERPEQSATGKLPSIDTSFGNLDSDKLDSDDGCTLHGRLDHTLQDVIS